ncbi:MAG: ATP-dependent DNA ligase [Actinomycetota bacterium]|nr:ATP-dependent DNA ligase [Actinomycetota bacterium]
MEYGLIADTYERMEATSKRLEMTDHLVDLIERTPKELIDKVVYLTQGKLYPDYAGIEIGIAEKLAIRAIALATKVDEKVVRKSFERTGDLGETAQELLEGKAFKVERPLTVEKVFETLDKIARTSGRGAIETKMNLLSNLLRETSPKEAKYIVRTVTGKLRLGVADMTMLDALSVVYAGGKGARGEVERAYNISSDLGAVASTVARGGLAAIRKFGVQVGKPIRSMLAERLRTPQDILEKMGGACAAEYKYDGERIQIHKRVSEVALFSRRLENITHQYPDVVELTRKSIRAKEAIAECECVAVDLETGELRPFQELMHRRRKYGIKEAMELYPISIFAFDLLFVDGDDLTSRPYPERREHLEKVLAVSDRAGLTRYRLVRSAEELEKFFEEAIQDGCEGVVCKSVGSHAVYQAGARGWLWIKYKRDYRSEMTDTVDLVVVGAFHGRGRRAGTYGALLLGAYDPREDTFKTVTKCGAGFTDDDLARLPKMFEDYRISHRHSRVVAKLEADVWFTPSVVLEIIGAEITLSPIHICGLDKVRKGSGLAIRFPRFTGNYRLDKAPEDATTEEEIIEMYQSRLKRLPA